MSLTLKEYINTIVSRIIKLNKKIYYHRKEHMHIEKTISRIKTSCIRCFKCEVMGMRLINALIGI